MCLVSQRTPVEEECWQAPRRGTLAAMNSCRQSGRRAASGATAVQLHHRWTKLCPEEERQRASGEEVECDLSNVQITERSASALQKPRGTERQLGRQCVRLDDHENPTTTCTTPTGDAEQGREHRVAGQTEGYWPQQRCQAAHACCLLGRPCVVVASSPLRDASTQQSIRRSRPAAARLLGGSACGTALRLAVPGQHLRRDHCSAKWTTLTATSQVTPEPDRQGDQGQV
ncbi:hypothetical protein TREES_T100007367 [Tupaia chinensis]|uniref:Uncharacterized protein n=1 Tax=Tupaia chinensis TaxID=246437 RepID=L9L442_TUPCH|nr:hypothetical protein TREES_T100007367 [Tupaia chinensis]